MPGRVLLAEDCTDYLDIHDSSVFFDSKIDGVSVENN